MSDRLWLESAKDRNVSVGLGPPTSHAHDIGPCVATPRLNILSRVQHLVLYPCTQVL